MTSAVSKEDLKAELWVAGVRTPYRMDKMMRLIEIYALAKVRTVAPLEDAEPVSDPHARLAPGECDPDYEVTRCKCCEKIKDWHSFHVDSGNPPSMRKIRCKSCLRESKPPQSYKCRSCGLPKILADFPPEKTLNRSAPVHCNDCQEGKTFP